MKRRDDFKIKKITALLALLLCGILLVSCGGNTHTEPPSSASAHITFTDDLGNVVSLSEKPKKVAVLFSSYAQMTLLSGGSVDVTVAESIERGFAEPDTPLVDSGAGKKINSELLISQTPDLVIGSLDIAAHVQTAELLSECGIATALFHVESFEDYERVMQILCDIFDSPEKYEENVVNVRRKIDSILEEIPEGEEKKILFVRCASSAKATKAKNADNNFVCKMLTDMNTYNIADNAPVLLDGLSTEEIILENPDFIFFSCMGDENAAKAYMTDVMLQPEWQALDAVKNNKYAFLDKELFQYKPNNKWDKAYEILAELLYD